MPFHHFFATSPNITSPHLIDMDAPGQSTGCPKPRLSGWARLAQMLLERRMTLDGTEDHSLTNASSTAVRRPARAQAAT
jgi:hypothetical protein